MTDVTTSQTTDPILHHSLVTAAGREPERWLLVLHGIFGKGRNWASIARRLTEARPEWGTVLVDLRLHGDSRGFRAPHTLESSAADVARLVRHLDRPADALLGHSFGGKVALEYAQRAPTGLRQVWVMDSTPAVKIPSGAAWRMIEILRQMPQQFDSRAEAVAGLERHGYATGLAQWMAMNLEPAGDGGYRWALELDAMEAMLRDFFRTELWNVVERPPVGQELHFVKASESDTMDEETAARIEAAGQRSGRVFLHRLPGGHWINTDNPDGVLELLRSTLP